MSATLGREPPVSGQDEARDRAEDVQHEFADALRECYDLLTTPKLSEVPYRSPQDQAWMAARVVDFDLWTASTGAFARDKNGLCQKVSSVPETIEVFTTLLRSLSAVWRRYEGSANTVRSTFQVVPRYTDPQDHSSHSADVSRLDVDGYQREIETLLHCLVDLGLSIREAGSSSRTRKADLSFDSRHYNAFQKHLAIVLQSSYAYEAEHSDQLETKHAVTKLLNIGLRPEQDRMIEANLRRRHRCEWASYRAGRIKNSNAAKEHETQQQPGPTDVSIANMEGTVDLPNIPIHAVAVRHSRTAGSVSTVKTTVLQSALKQKMPISAPIVIPRSRPSTRNTKITAEVVHPRPPRIALLGAVQSFQCPYCRDTLPSDMARSRSAWKKHLAQDLQPYTCPFTDCQTPCSFFVERSALLEHWETCHFETAPWSCTFCMDETRFTDESSFTEHLQLEHNESLLEDDIPSVVEMSRHRRMMMPEICPVCPCTHSDTPEESAWVDHICKCLHDFSQRALPWNDRACVGRIDIAKQEFLPESFELYRSGKTEFGDDWFYHLLPDLEPADQVVKACNSPMRTTEARHVSVDTWYPWGPTGVLVDASALPNTPPPLDESDYAWPDDVKDRTESPTRELGSLTHPPIDTKAYHEGTVEPQWAELSDENYFDDSSSIALSALGFQSLSRDKILRLKNNLSNSAELVLQLKPTLTTPAGPPKSQAVPAGQSGDCHGTEGSPARGHTYPNVFTRDNGRMHVGDNVLVQHPAHDETLSSEGGSGHKYSEVTGHSYARQHSGNVHHYYYYEVGSDSDLNATLDLVSKVSSSLRTLENALDLRPADGQAPWTSAVYLLIEDSESVRLTQSATSETPPCQIRTESPLHLLQLCITHHAPDIRSPTYISHITNHLTKFNELIEIALEKDWSKMLLACAAYCMFVSRLYPPDFGPLRRNCGPVKLLSIDGGGVRGMTALLVLERIMVLTNQVRQRQGLERQEPWQIFDLMGGTGTGGLIAIMLGRLRMTMNEAIYQYGYLSEQAFTKKNMMKPIGWGAALGLLKSKFKTARLEEALKKVIGEDWETKLLNDGSEGSGKVFLVCHQTDSNSLRIMRSYKTPEKAAPRSEWKLFQAARATSAAPQYFEPMEIDGIEYRDGGLMQNNPVALLHAEAGEVFEGREQIIVSLGTGLVMTKAFDPSIKTIAKDLADIAADTERVADEFFRRDGSRLANENRYFRFNVPHIGEKGLAESSPEGLMYLEKMTLTYVNNAQITEEMQTCSTKLAEGASVPMKHAFPTHEEVAAPEAQAWSN